jgi:hypothetical protein
VPNYQHRRPGWGYQYGMRPGTYPRMATPYPGMQQAILRAEIPNRYGVDWYDGQADGEGAWYKLAGQGEWPRVSQYINSQPYP